VHKHIRSVVTADEAPPFGIIEPLDRAYFHSNPLNVERGHIPARRRTRRDDDRALGGDVPPTETLKTIPYRNEVKPDAGDEPAFYRTFLLGDVKSGTLHS
jgi:hypothetical protein